MNNDLKYWNDRFMSSDKVYLRRQGRAYLSGLILLKRQGEKKTKLNSEFSYNSEL